MVNAKTGNNRTTQLLNEIGLEIVKGIYSYGENFPTESELCGQYGASRSIIREVVKMLSSKGMLASKARKGTWVLPTNERNVLDSDVLRWMLVSDTSLQLLTEFVAVRREIEPAAAALAAEYATEEQLRDIDQALENMRNCHALDDDSASLEADIEFHLSILSASNNRFMQQMRHLVECALRVSIQLSNASKGVGHASLQDHLDIATAIKQGKHSLARKNALRLIDESYDLILQCQVNKVVIEK